MGCLTGMVAGSSEGVKTEVGQGADLCAFRLEIGVGDTVGDTVGGTLAHRYTPPYGQNRL